MVKRCFALSGVYDMKRFMDGDYDDNFYFNNPVDYVANLSRSAGCSASWRRCDIHLATGTGPWEHSGEAYRLSQISGSRGIRHHLDDWGPLGGHDWPYWKHQMREYLLHGAEALTLLMSASSIEPSSNRRMATHVRSEAEPLHQVLAAGRSPAPRRSRRRSSRVRTSMCVRDFQAAPVWLP